ncbi:MAG: hypothetical protein ACOY94_09340 [Bacillota bacterium]
MRALRKTLSVLLLLIIIPLLIGQIAIVSVRSLLIDPTVPKQVMRQSGLYAEVEQAIMQDLLEEMESQKESLPLPPRRIERIINQVFPAERLAQVAEQLIDGIYAWVWSNDPQPVLVLDLSDIRRTLPIALRAEVEAEVASLPVCNAAQLRQLMLQPPTGMPPCKAADEKVNAAFIDKVLKDLDIGQIVPQQIDLARELAGERGPAYWEEAWLELQPLRTVFSLVLVGWGVITILLLLLALLNLDRWYTPFAWVGAAGALAGIPLVLVGLGGTNYFVPMVLSSVQADAASQSLGTAVALAIQTVSAALRNLSFTVLLFGLAATAVAVYGKTTEPEAQGPAL